MEFALILALLTLTLPLSIISFFVGRRFGVKNVCHTGQVRYAVTGDRRFAVNVTLSVDKTPVKFFVRVPVKDSVKLARAILDEQEVEVEGGSAGEVARPTMIEL
jgi:hypothetical protein